MPGGSTPRNDLFNGKEEGLVVEQLLGAGQGNELGGDFKANVALGYRIENGEVVGRVKDTMIAGNVYEALNSVEAVSDDRRWVFDRRGCLPYAAGAYRSQRLTVDSPVVIPRPRPSPATPALPLSSRIRSGISTLGQRISISSRPSSRWGWRRETGRHSGH